MLKRPAAGKSREGDFCLFIKNMGIFIKNYFEPFYFAVPSDLILYRHFLNCSEDGTDD